MDLVKTTAVVAAAAGAFIVGMPTARASGYYGNVSYQTYMPSSWRGSYVTTQGDTLKVYKYSIFQNGEAMVKSSWSGWRKLAFAHVYKNRYTLNALAKIGANSTREWVRTTSHGHRVLIHYGLMGYRVVWHQRYSPFHGYKRANVKADYSYNTFYDKQSRSTLADYRPTQYSKVIFRYGSHVVPTSHT
ncbi:hypothetical protein [uncultured Secundilactobacillus sp.]|uniref:hypothetical protein n=1 Tax=uncultured Secundilactobacillus sp. TaxID=2813935 RepID=UPI002586DB97|nr:hypothetical protein [uncultured Secundilactobacillus sp.]